MKYALWVVAGLIFAFLALPIAVIVILSFTSASYLSFPPPGLSLRWYAQVMGSPEWMAAIGASFRIALGAMALSTVLSVMVAVALVRGVFRWKKAIYALVLAPMIVPQIISTLGIYFFFADVNLVGSSLAVVLGHTVIALPVATILISGTLQGFDVRLEQAALSLGAGRWTAFRRVTLPLIAPGVISAALFSFLTSFDELLVPLFVAGPFNQTLPVKMWNTVLFGIEPTIAAVSTLLVGVTVLVLGGSALIRGAGARSNS